MDRQSGEQKGRGCVYFNFGTAYALNLLVSLYSLRKHYKGPVTVFLAPDAHSDALKRDLEHFGADVRFLENLSRSYDRHRIFHESPYATTLSFDSDIIFQGPIDALWEPLEREGVLVTRFFVPPYGIDGTEDSPGEFCRVELFEKLQGLVDAATYERTIHRILHERIDINIGIWGISRPKGEAFLADWAEHMERGRGKSILLLDELLVVTLINKYPHFLADEIWNCPADEYFRRTNLADAVAIHYFADGNRRAGNLRIGRNALTWAGRKWYQAYFEASAAHDLSYWRVRDRKFDRRAEQLAIQGPAPALRSWLQNIRREMAYGIQRAAQKVRSL